MKYITFYREHNNFDDIKKDPNLIKKIHEKIQWENYLTIGISDDDKIFSYITLKFGDDIRTNLVKDYSPIPNIDYTVKKR
jgi:hypothetical protein